MSSEYNRRKPRVPLSKEEVFYLKKIKTLKELQKIEAFKATFFYRVVHSINIILAGLLTYYLLSILILSSWQQSTISHVICTYDKMQPEQTQPNISELQIKIISEEIISLKTDNLFEGPKVNQAIFIGKDYLFNKTLQVKLAFDERSFWSINAYALLSVCLFALGIGFFIYKINMHLTTNGLLAVFGLFVLASCYFILI